MRDLGSLRTGGKTKLGFCSVEGGPNIADCQEIFSDLSEREEGYDSRRRGVRTRCSTLALAHKGRECCVNSCN